MIADRSHIDFMFVDLPTQFLDFPLSIIDVQNAFGVEMLLSAANGSSQISMYLTSKTDQFEIIHKIFTRNLYE